MRHVVYYKLYVLLIFILASCAPVGTPTPSPLLPPSPTPSFRITQGQTERIPAEVSNPVLDNCGGSGDISRTLNRGRVTTVVFEVTLSAQVGVDLATLINAELSNTYRVEQGEELTASDEVNVTIAPGSKVRYQVQWYETWDTGTVEIEPFGLSIPYRIRRGFDADVGSQRESCDGVTPTTAPSHTPVPSSTPQPPTATFTSQPQPMATNTIVVASGYPCTGQIPGVGGLLNQVRVLPDSNSPSRPPVSRGTTVRVLRETTDFGTTWYEIEYESNTGWIPGQSQYIELGSNCP